MPILTEFAGLPVVEFPFKSTKEGWRQELRRIQESAEDPSAPPAVAWRLRIGGRDQGGEEGEEAEYFSRFLASVDTESVTAMVIGDFFDSAEGGLWQAAEQLVEHADALPNLRAVYFGDINADECELSWICPPDLAPLVSAYPQLEQLVVKGALSALGGQLKLHVPSHASLRSLTVEAGGLPCEVVREVASSGLPALEHLELWLGVEEYGGDTTPVDLEPVLSGKAFPGLRSLGVRNAERVNEWVSVLADAPVLQGLEVLDLSLGTLNDEGGRVLVERVEAFSGLRKLDLHHHFLSEEMEQRVRSVFEQAGVEIDLSERLEPRYTSPRGEGEQPRPRYYTAAAE